MHNYLTIVRDGNQGCRRGKTRILCSPVHRPAALCGRARSSQQVDDVGEEDEAYDGEKHQHQNVHHDGNTVRDGREVWPARRTRSKTAAPPPVKEIGQDRSRSEQIGG